MRHLDQSSLFIFEVTDRPPSPPMCTRVRGKVPMSESVLPELGSPSTQISLSYQYLGDCWLRRAAAGGSSTTLYAYHCTRAGRVDGHPEPGAFSTPPPADKSITLVVLQTNHSIQLQLWCMISKGCQFRGSICK